MAIGRGDEGIAPYESITGGAVGRADVGIGPYGRIVEGAERLCNDGFLCEKSRIGGGPGLFAGKGRELMLYSGDGFGYNRKAKELLRRRY